MVFLVCGKEYCGSTALEIVNAIRREASKDNENGTSRQFIMNSLAELHHRIPVGETSGYTRLDDETFALSYLYLRDEYGLGELSDVPHRNLWARPLHLT
jgi:hypothetical protein